MKLIAKENNIDNFFEKKFYSSVYCNMSIFVIRLFWSDPNMFSEYFNVDKLNTYKLSKKKIPLEIK